MAKLLKRDPEVEKAIEAQGKVHQARFYKQPSQSSDNPFPVGTDQAKNFETMKTENRNMRGKLIPGTPGDRLLKKFEFETPNPIDIPSYDDVVTDSEGKKQFPDLTQEEYNTAKKIYNSNVQLFNIKKAVAIPEPEKKKTQALIPPKSFHNHKNLPITVIGK